MIWSSTINASLATFSEAWFVFVHGGWVIFGLLALWLAFQIYMMAINGRYLKGITWKFLHIKVEKENLQSLLAVEQIFAQLHALESTITWAGKYLEGQLQLWFSLEIVSLGGKISYIMRVPDKYVNLVESAFYAQFPSAEITEVHDYMEHLKKWDPEKSSWDLWGTEWGMLRDYAYPIKTYKDFEHPISENKILDPLAGLLEALSKAEPHELMAVQIDILPMKDSAWQPHAQETVNAFKGVKPEEKIGAFGKFINFFTGKTSVKKEEERIAAVQKLTEGEKRTLLAVETKMSKVGWGTKIRSLYIAPKDKMDNTKKTGIVGAFRQFSGITTNNLKPNMKIWTGYSYKVFQTLEQPFVDWVIAKRKERFIEGFANRDMWIGADPVVLNAEELTTLFHFPLATTTTPPVERIEVKKGQPPANLPVAG